MPPSNVAQLRTRKPTGRPSWPLILLAGEAKTGKTWQLCEFTGDPRVGKAFVMDLNEGTADEYGAVPGADFEIVEHDGTWVDIVGQVAAVKEVARAELEAGNLPVVLGIDSMTAEWFMLSAWANARAKRSKNNRKLLTEDPDAEIDVTSNYWNDATSRHNELMNMLKTFPGIVIMTALETEKTQFGPGGRPIEGAPKVAKPDGQKRLPADSSVWVRLSLTEAPTIVGMRSVKRTIQPGKDQPKPWADFTLAKLVFDELGIASGVADVRNMPTLDADQRMPNEEPERPPQGDQHGRGQDQREGQPRGGQQSPAQRNRLVENTVNKLLTISDVDRAGEAQAWVDDQAIRTVNVSGLMSTDDRETLDVHQDDELTLSGLAAKVCDYVGRHKRSPRNPLDANLPGDNAAAAATAAAGHADGPPVGSEAAEEVDAHEAAERAADTPAA